MKTFLGLSLSLVAVAACSADDVATNPDASAPVDAAVDVALDTAPPTPDAAPDSGLPADGGTDATDDGGACATLPPQNSIGVQSLKFTTIHLGEATLTGTVSASAWKDYGYNLDGLCTTKASTDVCTLVQGSPKAVQVDGTGGNDNSWGANIVPIWQSALGVPAMSVNASQSPSYLVLDANGKGGFAFTLGGIVMIVPLLEAHVVLSAGKGTIAGVVDTEAYINNVRTVAGTISVSLCAPSTFDSIAQQIRQANDILLDGTNHNGTACTGMSIAIGFEGATSYGGSLPTITSSCGDL